ncbi:hypothetical protein [Azohydromonas lata]|uniref:Secreted protein n=1 Tax=Azohydromonas lata TaxID=45677 RepID=A0ABU5ICY3_9BURK|nr:hypothetical protein [Azohydromonas lata]MDZ5456817.1 hypothetical protein [Azohydromonas lata]
MRLGFSLLLAGQYLAHDPQRVCEGRQQFLGLGSVMALLAKAGNEGCLPKHTRLAFGYMAMSHFQQRFMLSHAYSQIPPVVAVQRLLLMRAQREFVWRRGGDFYSPGLRLFLLYGGSYITFKMP